MSVGVIYNIEEMSIHDGPGVRVVTFLKGCPLRCIWCHNPEGLSQEPEVMRRRKGCDQCGTCMQSCGHLKCQGFEVCVKSCPKGLVNVVGEVVDSKVLLSRLKTYAPALKQLGGGITFSGGEPLMQPEFLADLLIGLKPMHVALETSGYTDSRTFKWILELADLVMFDIKLIDPELHRRYTGVNNQMILDNLAILKKSGRQFVIRMPMIPGINDNQAHYKGVADLIKDASDRVSVEVLAYNELAGVKYEMLGRQFVLKNEKTSSNTFPAHVFDEAGIRWCVL